MSLPLVLASSSVYRRALLEKLDLAFECASPDVDESALADEAPEMLVERLAIVKARALAGRFPNALIIGSDQMAIGPDGQALGKPHTVEKAVAQLLSFSGKSVMFVTGLALLNSATGRVQSVCDPYVVHFRELSQAQIERYVAKEQPLSCAGSFKSEGYGITLFEAFTGSDPNSLIGLPLIELIRFLAQEGVSLP